MKTGFKDRTEPKKVEPKMQSREKDYPFEFSCPSYDERSSCYMRAGTNYGVGVTQPVGSMEHKSSDVIPKGRVDTLKIYDR